MTRSSISFKAKNPRKFSFLLCIALMVSGWQIVILAQVNTETLRKTDLQDGIHPSLSLNVGFQSGNTNFLSLKTGGRLDYRSGNYYSFLVITYERGSQGNNVFVNKGFAHYRHILRLRRNLLVEAFLQKEFDDFILLNDRNLIGGGVRLPVVNATQDSSKILQRQLFLGLGIMWENEELNENQRIETNMVRSTNYISLIWQFEERVKFSLIAYYQVSTEQFSDYRILTESALTFRLGKVVVFQTALRFRFDNEPPSNVKKHDLELTNGIQLIF